MQRARRFPGAQGRVCFSRLGQGELGIEMRPRLHIVLARGDALKAGTHKCLGGEFSLADGIRGSGGRQRCQIRHSWRLILSVGF